MNHFRTRRFVTALLALTSLLFTHFALAFYQCPGEDIRTATNAIAAEDHAGGRAGAGCQGIDLKQPGLCYAHVQAGNQSPDKPELPTAQPFVAAALVIAASDFNAASDAVFVPADDAHLLTRSIAPPIAIRHCCLRV